MQYNSNAVKTSHENCVNSENDFKNEINDRLTRIETALNLKSIDDRIFNRNNGRHYNQSYYRNPNRNNDRNYSKNEAKNNRNFYKSNNFYQKRSYPQNNRQFNNRFANNYMTGPQVFMPYMHTNQIPWIFDDSLNRWHQLIYISIRTEHFFHQ